MTAEQSAADEMVERGVSGYEIASGENASGAGVAGAIGELIPGVSLADLARLAPEIARLASGEAVCVPVADMDRAATLIRLLTVRQVIEAGDEAISAAGLNPWAMNEGLATGDERIDAWWLDADARPQPGSASDGR